jgi:hypothetical protein
LQSEINRVIAHYGGRQVALNEIALPHGASMLFPLPDQRVAHILPGTPPLPVNKAQVARAAGAARPAGLPVWFTGETWYGPNGASCPYFYLCAWQDVQYTGVQFNVSWCNVWQELPGSGWTGNGDVVNNESFGTTGYLGDSNEQVFDPITPSTPVTGPPLISVWWQPIWYLMACQD